MSITTAFALKRGISLDTAEELEQRLRETMKPDDARAEELTLKMLGLVPAVRAWTPVDSGSSPDPPTNTPPRRRRQTAAATRGARTPG